ncbi:MAG: plastocyanin/azurin family copper-binding protein [Egibacteraceae bacterium]
MARTLLVLLALVTALALAGCSKEQPEFTANDQVPAEQRTGEAPAGGVGGGQQAGTLAGVWVVQGAALKFDQAPTTLPAGKVTIELQNMSGLPHDVVFEGVQGSKPVVETEGKGSRTGTVELTPGTYTYYCNVPGHRGAGMEGTVTVQ